MSDTATQKSSYTSPLRQARDAESLSREKVVRLLDPPISSKTLDRWERGQSPVPRHRLRELAAIYRVPVADLEAAA